MLRTVRSTGRVQRVGFWAAGNSRRGSARRAVGPLMFEQGRTLPPPVKAMTGPTLSQGSRSISTSGSPAIRRGQLSAMWFSTRLLSRPFPAARSVSEMLGATSYVHRGRSMWIWPLPGSSQSASRDRLNSGSKRLTLSIILIRALEVPAQRQALIRPTLDARAARLRRASFRAHSTRGFCSLDSKCIGKATD